MSAAILSEPGRKLLVFEMRNPPVLSERSCMVCWASARRADSAVSASFTSSLLTAPEPIDSIVSWLTRRASSRASRVAPRARSVSRPRASIAYTLTLARLASLITER